jgi:1,4-dihydroxy-2-naphthoate octaprenyltransferase
MDEAAPADMADIPDGRAQTSVPLASSPVAATSMASSRRVQLHAWIGLCRPRTLVLTLAPAGTALAFLIAGGQRINVGIAALTLLALTLGQSGANLLDAHLDFERVRQARWAGVVDDAAPEGPHLLLARQGLLVLRVGFVLQGLAACVGLVLVSVGGAIELALGAFGIAVAFLYSATGYAFKRLPGGELPIFVALGPALVAATLLAQRQAVTSQALVLGCALGFFATASVEVVRIRDAARQVAGALAGASPNARLARWIVCLCGAGAYLAAAAVVALGGRVVVAVPLLTLPVTLLAVVAAARSSSVIVLDRVADEMLRMYTWFSLLLVAGILIDYGGQVVLR